MHPGVSLRRSAHRLKFAAVQLYLNCLQSLLVLSLVHMHVCHLNAFVGAVYSIHALSLLPCLPQIASHKLREPMTLPQQLSADVVSLFVSIRCRVGLSHELELSSDVVERYHEQL